MDLLTRIPGRVSLRFLALLLTFGWSVSATAQTTFVPNPSFAPQWEAYPALNQVTALASAYDRIFAATTGGVFVYAPESGDIQRFTTVDGLYGVGATAIVFDGAANAVWVGYGDGVLDRIDLAAATVTTIFDIARATQYTDRGVRRLRLYDDRLYAATGFGIVEMNPATGIVRDMYPRLGTLGNAIAVRDVIEAPLPTGTLGVWAASEGGVARAPREGANLREPGAWTVESGPTNALSLKVFDGRLYAGAGDGLHERDASGNWTRVFATAFGVRHLVVAEGRLVALDPFALWVRHDDGSFARRVAGSEYLDLRAFTLGPGAVLWAGDFQQGLFAPRDLEPLFNTALEIERSVVPEGPWSNLPVGIAYGRDGALWASFSGAMGRLGIGRLQDGRWVNYGADTGDIAGASYALWSAFVHPDGTFWAGSDGDGVTAVTPEGTPVTYRQNNSTLTNAAGIPNFVVVRGLAADREGDMWVVNPYTNTRLHRRDTNGQWTHVPLPAGVPSAVRLDRLIIDRFGQKWFTARFLQGNIGTGIAVLSADNERLNYLSGAGSGGVGLPDATVNAVVEDLDGRIWLGTARGLGLIFAPGSAFVGDAASLVTWPITTTEEGGAAFFLRDLAINDIAVDPGNGKWLASNDGSWLINPAGNQVQMHFTTQNSPLVSNVVRVVAVDPMTGRVMFATDQGLISYAGEARGPAAGIETLRAAPNPFRVDQHANGVLISGLVAETTVRIMSATGYVVARLDARGGTVRWNGRDDRTGEPVRSGVYIIAATGTDGQGTAFGKVAVIH
ncbi:hypothetical protein BH23BAC4_BH23BAC4_17750 [soil metagenome]